MSGVRKAGAADAVEANVDASTSPDLGTGDERVARVRSGGSALFSLFVVLVAASALWLSRNYDFKTGLFPWVIGIVVLALAIAQLIRECMCAYRARVGSFASAGAEGIAEPDPEIPPGVAARRTAIIFAWIAGYFLSIWLLGFAIGGAICAFLQLKFDGRERWLVSLALALAVWGSIYFFFGGILGTPFPPGRLFIWMNLPPFAME